jgi:hypothetical protein
MRSQRMNWSAYEGGQIVWGNRRRGAVIWVR